MDGPNRCSGRVEVFYGQQWGTVCGDSWDIRDAEVVCQQLGCGKALSTPASAYFGKGSGPIWLDDVNCTGTETALSKCETSLWGAHNCSHGEDAGVVCLGKSLLFHLLIDIYWMWRDAWNAIRCSLPILQISNHSTIQKNCFKQGCL